jgi:hypothetical protein
MRSLLLVALVPLGGCISATPFAGAIIEMTITGAQPTAADAHIEMWARTKYDDIVRLDTQYDAPNPANPTESTPLRPFGFIIRDAINMGDPCMIDLNGNLITSPDAYPNPVVVAGITESPQDQAEAVIFRIAQVTSSNDCDGAAPPNCGHQATTALAAVPFDANAAQPPVIPFATDPATRLQLCNSYWSTSPLAYTPNPLQLQTPQHGTVDGFLDYTTQSPVSGYNSVKIKTSVNLDGLRELFATVETIDADDLANNRPDGVDPLNRGPVFFQGYPSQGGRGVVYFNLTGPGAAGSASVLADLDQDTESF